VRLGQSIRRREIHNGLDLDVFRVRFSASSAPPDQENRSCCGQSSAQPVRRRRVEIFRRIFCDSGNDQREIEKHWGVLFSDWCTVQFATVAQNIEVPLKEYYDMPLRLMDEIAAFKIGIVGLSNGTGEKYPSQLSGGCANAPASRAPSVVDPEIVFLDEPTAAWIRLQLPTSTS